MVENDLIYRKSIASQEVVLVEIHQARAFQALSHGLASQMVKA